jgi:hypothetical protein
MAQAPTPFVCHGDDGGPRVHPCRRVQEALRGAGIDYDKAPLPRDTGPNPSAGVIG